MLGSVLGLEGLVLGPDLGVDGQVLGPSLKACVLVNTTVRNICILFCLSLRQRLNTLCWEVSDHMDIFLNQLIQFCTNNAINLRFLPQRIMPCYTHKMTIVS